jgi:acetyltransferase EpsM
MMVQHLVVIGGGEHARVVIETARSRPDLWSVDGFADPEPCEDTQRRLGVRWLGTDTAVLGRPGLMFVLGIGAVGVGDTRRALVERYAAAGARFATLVHATAWVSPTARIHEGAVVFAGAVVQTAAEIGAHAVVGTRAVIEHDVHLGAFAQAGPGVVTGGGVKIGDGAYLGLGACVRDHITIGERAMVAMGAVVTADVAAGATVLGVPARARGDG